jgi:hypothetical protein
MVSECFQHKFLVNPAVAGFVVVVSVVANVAQDWVLADPVAAEARSEGMDELDV